VETAEHLEYLNELGCRIAQGFHLGRPLPAAEATATLLQGLAPESLISARDVLDIRPSQLGDDASLIGAAELAFTPLLAQPGRIDEEQSTAAEG